MRTPQSHWLRQRCDRSANRLGSRAETAWIQDSSRLLKQFRDQIMGSPLPVPTRRGSCLAKCIGERPSQNLGAQASPNHSTEDDEPVQIVQEILCRHSMKSTHPIPQVDQCLPGIGNMIERIGSACSWTPSATCVAVRATKTPGESTERPIMTLICTHVQSTRHMSTKCLFEFLCTGSHAANSCEEIGHAIMCQHYTDGWPFAATWRGVAASSRTSVVGPPSLLGVRQSRCPEFNPAGQILRSRCQTNQQPVAPPKGRRRIDFKHCRRPAYAHAQLQARGIRVPQMELLDVRSGSSSQITERATAATTAIALPTAEATPAVRSERAAPGTLSSLTEACVTNDSENGGSGRNRFCIVLHASDICILNGAKR